MAGIGKDKQNFWLVDKLGHDTSLAHKELRFVRDRSIRPEVVKEASDLINKLDWAHLPVPAALCEKIARFLNYYGR